MALGIIGNTVNSKIFSLNKAHDHAEIFIKNNKLNYKYLTNVFNHLIGVWHFIKIHY